MNEETQKEKVERLLKEFRETYARRPLLMSIMGVLIFVFTGAFIFISIGSELLRTVMQAKWTDRLFYLAIFLIPFIVYFLAKAKGLL